MKISEIVDAAYGMENGNGNLQFVQNKIFIQVEKEQSPEKVLALIGLTDFIEEIELFDPYSDIYLITLNVKLADILLICKNLEEYDMCIFAHPNFFRILKQL